MGAKTEEQTIVDEWKEGDTVRVAYNSVLSPDQRGRSGVVTRVHGPNDMVEVRVVTYVWLPPADLVTI